MRIFKSIAEHLLAALILPLLALFRLLPFAWASAIGGAIVRSIGPRLAISRRARRNLRFIFPAWDETRITTTVAEMWDNLGRNFAEYNALDRLDYSADVTVIGAEHEAVAINSGKPILYLSAHIGNWEVIAHYFAKCRNPVTIVYRPANNRAVDRVIQSIRAKTGLIFAAKGKAASKALIASLSQEGRAIVLMDQKMGDGELLPFLGQPAMTGTGWARLALKYDAVILPIYVSRKAAHLTLHIEPALQPSTLGLPDDSQQAARELAIMANAMYGNWITARPGQWLWLHMRWGKRLNVI
jgi:Kdo2-lipid IVA lauroyltransferase/acyltransferase